MLFYLTVEAISKQYYKSMLTLQRLRHYDLYGRISAYQCAGHKRHLPLSILEKVDYEIVQRLPICETERA